MRIGTRGLILALLGCVALSVPAARADFTTIDDFEALTPGPIGGQGGWTAPDAGSTVAGDPADSQNQVLSVITESTILYRELIVPAGAIRMLFFRFRVEDQASLSFGLSDLVHPDRFDHFEVELSVTNSPTELRINDDGTYDVLTALSEVTWYNCWVFVDNAANDMQVWLHARAGDDATAADRLASDGLSTFFFRNGTSGDLQTFYVKTGGGAGVDGPVLFDDIHLEETDTLNLSNPAGVPPVAADAATWGRIKRQFGSANED